MSFPKKVRIVEVSPRDGLQNEKIVIPTQTKIDLINKLSQTGLQSIEVTSFVSEKRIPQLADATEVFQGIHKNPTVTYSALVPNARGVEVAIAAGVKHIAVFSTVSETFSQKNTHCTIAESLARIKEIIAMAKPLTISVRGYISCVLGCPYEGEMPVEKTVHLANQLKDLGCNEISLGDTIGVGTPFKARNLITAVARDIAISELAIHFHDTYGQALANIYACLELGISVIDSSVGGLGGCPYAKGASGNVATEDLLYMLEGLGIETGVDMAALLKVSQFVTEFTHRRPCSNVAQTKL